MSKKQKPMTDKQYRDSGGCQCPFCRGTDVVGGHVEVDAGGATQEVSCNDCDRSWIDCYNLTGYIQREPET